VSSSFVQRRGLGVDRLSHSKEGARRINEFGLQSRVNGGRGNSDIGGLLLLSIPGEFQFDGQDQANKRLGL
jgi:hypothetical protein